MPKLKLSELKKLEWNPRTIKKEDLDKLTKSIEKFWVIEWRPFLVSNRTGENIIIWGNQRYEVCKKLGITEVPVHIMEWLTEEEEKEIIIRDNISNWEWDWDILANEWDKEELEEWWLDVTFDTVEPEAEEDDFEVDEGVQTDIVLGDLFEIWPHRLLCVELRLWFGLVFLVYIVLRMPRTLPYYSVRCLRLFLLLDITC